MLNKADSLIHTCPMTRNYTILQFLQQEVNIQQTSGSNGYVYQKISRNVLTERLLTVTKKKDSDFTETTGIDHISQLDLSAQIAAEPTTDCCVIL